MGVPPVLWRMPWKCGDAMQEFACEAGGRLFFCHLVCLCNWAHARSASRSSAAPADWRLVLCAACRCVASEARLASQINGAPRDQPCLSQDGGRLICRGQASPCRRARAMPGRFCATAGGAWRPSRLWASRGCLLFVGATAFAGTLPSPSKSRRRRYPSNPRQTFSSNPSATPSLRTEFLKMNLDSAPRMDAASRQFAGDGDFVRLASGKSLAVRPKTFLIMHHI